MLAARLAGIALMQLQLAVVEMEVYRGPSREGRKGLGVEDQ